MHPAGSVFCPVTGQRIRCARRVPSAVFPIVAGFGALLVASGLWLGCADAGACGLPMASLLPPYRTPSLMPSLTLSPTPTPTRTPTRTPAASTTPTPTTPVVTLAPSPSPTVAPLSGQIAYSFGVGHYAEIYVMDPDGSDPRQVTFNDYQDRAPSFSPDGQSLVFSSYRENGWQLHVLNLLDLTERHITAFADQARFPSWSPVPGDDRILFERRSADGFGNGIWVTRSDGGGEWPLTEWGAYSRPAWSPDGSRILFGLAGGDNNADGRVTASDYLDTFVQDLATNRVDNLTRSPGADEHQAAWSPDGQWVAVTRVSQDTNGDGAVNLDDTSDLSLMRPDGSGLINLSQGRFSAFSPSWSPDGQWLAFLRYYGPDQGEIWVMDRNGSRLRAITGRGSFLHPEWSR